MAGRRDSSVPPLKNSSSLHYTQNEHQELGARAGGWAAREQNTQNFHSCQMSQVLVFRSLSSRKADKRHTQEPTAIVKEIGLEFVFIVCRIHLFVPIVIRHLLSWCLRFASNRGFHNKVRTRRMHDFCWFTVTLTRGICTGRTKLSAATTKLRGQTVLELVNHLFTNTDFSTDFFTFPSVKSKRVCKGLTQPKSAAFGYCCCCPGT